MNGGTVRRIWLCADDYGLAPGVNAAIRDLIGRGRLNATSVMVVAPSCTAEQSELLAKAAQPLAIGLHITLTAPFQPLSQAFRSRHGGDFRPLEATLRHALLRRFDPAALSAEIEAQLAAFRQLFGRPPDFIDGHQHVHLFPQCRDAVLASAKVHAPGAWVRQCGGAQSPFGRLGDPKGLFIDLLSRAFRKRAAAQGTATNPAFAGTYSFHAEADFAQLFPGFLTDLPDSAVVMCHPGHVDAELRRLDPLTDLRGREYAYLVGEAFPPALDSAGVTLARL
jgi:predicted glycoside hydrolase/deacetylase ChbG (UPF0249 family)